MKLTKMQKDLIDLVESFPGHTTHQLAQLRGDRQSYETNLRDRLARLESAGHLRSVEHRCGGNVTRREWYVSACRLLESINEG